MITELTTLAQLDAELASRGLYLSSARLFPKGWHIEIRSRTTGKIFEMMDKSPFLHVSIQACIEKLTPQDLTKPPHLGTHVLGADPNLHEVKRVDPKLEVLHWKLLLEERSFVRSYCNLLKGYSNMRYASKSSEVTCKRCLRGIEAVDAVIEGM